MDCRSIRILLALIGLLGLFITGCDPTRHLAEDKYLLRKNELNIESEKGAVRKGEMRENLSKLIVQKNNTYALWFPYKVAHYNFRYNKFKNYTADQLPRSVERPVEFDSLLMRRSGDYMNAYLFNQGYFYPRVSDTAIIKGRKAYVTYNVNTGPNFTIRNILLNVDDSAVKALVTQSMNETVLKKGIPFSMNLLEQERSRITTYLKEWGYYRFTQENIVDFSLDTFNQAMLRNAYDPFENAAVVEAFDSNDHSLNINIVIREENPNAYKRYKINRVTVYPDNIGPSDARDSTMKSIFYNNVRFRYHDYYIKEQVLIKHIFFEPGKLFVQSDYEGTINKLNQLGVFQTVRIVMVDDTTRPAAPGEGWLHAIVLMTPAKKYDFTTTFEVSAGTTYTLGATPTITLRDRNLGKGANLLSLSLSGGIETFYDQERGENFFDHFRVLTKNFGFNMTLDLPKFLVPFNVATTKKNLPRTIIGFGSSFIDRTNFFTLINTAANLTYKWRETSTNSWEFSPAFVNIIRRPATSADFQARLDSNAFLANSYRENFIEGESIAFTYSNQFDNKGRSYSYLRLSLEEAGGILKGLNGLNAFNIPFAQYLKVDFDARRYVNRAKSQLAFRFYGGAGFPYGSSPTLPYIKQYFVGGAYSIRGWRIRTLGPGSYYDPVVFSDTPVVQSNNVYIDRTGDIKLELNGEYRFDILQMFGGTIKMTGALFADAGNIWLANATSSYPYGEFAFNKLGQDMAISTGAGARFNLAGFFIFRIDAAFPVKKPYNPQYDYGGWVLDQIDFTNRTWRANNLVINFAIGYPF